MRVNEPGQPGKQRSLQPVSGPIELCRHRLQVHRLTSDGIELLTVVSDPRREFEIGEVLMEYGRGWSPFARLHEAHGVAVATQLDVEQYACGHDDGAENGELQ